MPDDDVMERLWSGRTSAPAPRVQEPAVPEMPAVGVSLDELPDTGKYEAFKAVDRKPLSLHIYTHGNPANVHPAYQYYQYLADDGRGKIFDIVFGFFVVRVRGRNLLPVVQAISSGQCAFIQQYQRRAEWPEPGKNDTVIEKIEIIYQAAARTAMLEKGGNAST